MGRTAYNPLGYLTVPRAQEESKDKSIRQAKMPRARAHLFQMFQITKNRSVNSSNLLIQIHHYIDVELT